MNVTQQLITQLNLMHVVRVMDHESTINHESQAATHPDWITRTTLRSARGDITTAIPVVADLTNEKVGITARAPEENTKANLYLHQAVMGRRRVMYAILTLNKQPKKAWDLVIKAALESAKSPLFSGDRAEEIRPLDNTRRAVWTEPEYWWMCALNTPGPQAGSEDPSLAPRGNTPASAITGQACRMTPDSTNFHDAPPSSSSGQAPGPMDTSLRSPSFHTPSGSSVPAHSTTAHPSASTASTVPNQTSFVHNPPPTDMSDHDARIVAGVDQLLPPFAVSVQPHDNGIGTPSQPASGADETPASALTAQSQDEETDTQPGAPDAPTQSSDDPDDSPSEQL